MKLILTNSIEFYILRLCLFTNVRKMAAAGGNTSDSSSLLGEQTRPKNRYTPGSVPDYGPIYQDQSQSPTNVRQFINVHF